MEKDRNQDYGIGTGYIPASEVFSKYAYGQMIMMDVNLRAWGDLEVEIKLKPKEKVEKEVHDVLVNILDSNGDGIIDKEDVRELFAEFKISKNVDEFLNKFDENKKMKIEDVVDKMLADSNILMPIFAIYFRGN